MGRRPVDRAATQEAILGTNVSGRRSPMRHVRKTPLHKHCKQANGPRSNTRCVLTIIPDLISGAKRAVHRIRGPDAHTKSDFDEYDGLSVVSDPLSVVVGPDVRLSNDPLPDTPRVRRSVDNKTLL
jgi:hypothetical protein